MDEWFGLLSVVLIFLAVWGGASLTAAWREKQLVRSGTLPLPEKTTDADIARLANSGFKVWAIKRYRQLHQVSLKEAKRRVESMQGL